jgi:hypothetical protein
VVARVLLVLGVLDRLLGVRLFHAIRPPGTRV